MTSLLSASAYFKEALATHEAFRRLGYLSEEIFLHILGPDRDLSIQVVLKHKGLDFVVNIASAVRTAKMILLTQWKEVVVMWNNESDSPAVDYDKKIIWERSHVCQNSVSFLVAMLAKGFVHPAGKTTLN